MNKPKLYLIAGANATFKSTYAPVLVDTPSNTIHIDFDEEKNRAPKTAGIDDIIINKLKDLEITAFREKKDIAFQSNLIDPDDIKIFAEKAASNHYDFNAIFLSTTNIQQNIAYNALRGRQGFHCVSNYTIELSFENSYQAIKDNVNRFDELRVYDVTNDHFKNVPFIDNKYLQDMKPNKMIVEPKLILEVHKAKLVYKRPQMPLFYVEILNKIKNIPPSQNFKQDL